MHGDGDGLRLRRTFVGVWCDDGCDVDGGARDNGGGGGGHRERARGREDATRRARSRRCMTLCQQTIGKSIEQRVDSHNGSVDGADMNYAWRLARPGKMEAGHGGHASVTKPLHSPTGSTRGLRADASLRAASPRRRHAALDAANGDAAGVLRASAEGEPSAASPNSPAEGTAWEGGGDDGIRRSQHDNRTSEYRPPGTSITDTPHVLPPRPATEPAEGRCGEVRKRERGGSSPCAILDNFTGDMMPRCSPGAGLELARAGGLGLPSTSAASPTRRATTPLRVMTSWSAQSPRPRGTASASASTQASWRAATLARGTARSAGSRRSWALVCTSSAVAAAASNGGRAPPPDLVAAGGGGGPV